MVRLPAVIFPNSVEVRLKPQVPPQLDAPSPIVDVAWEARIVVPAVPLLRVPVRTRPLAVTDSALLVVDKDEERMKSPMPVAFESELKLVVPLVVRFEEIVIPSAAFTVRPWKKESVVSKVTEDPEAVAFKVTKPN